MKPSAEQQPEPSYLLLIDGDPIPYIIGWKFKDVLSDDALPEVAGALQVWMKDLLTITGDPIYGIMIGNDNPDYFRQYLYKYQPYKGQRVKTDWIAFWEPRIRKLMLEQYPCVCSPAHLETDDLLVIMGEEAHRNGYTPVYASPDKDLRQVAGLHLDFRLLGSDNFKGLESVSETEARWNMWMQVLTGDQTDNVAGVPGIGTVKATAILTPDSSFEWPSKVLSAFCKYFGPYYGPIIYKETYHTIRLLDTAHPYAAAHRPLFRFRDDVLNLFLSGSKSVSIASYRSRRTPIL